MRRRALVLIVILAAACDGPRRAGVASDAVLQEVSGTVTLIGEDIYILVADGAHGAHYAPTNLPPDFRRDGLRVVFSGDPGPIPDNVRLPGTPLVLKRIRPEDERR